MADGWSIVICGSGSTKIGLQSGKSRDENVVWGEWRSSQPVPTEFRLPADQQSLDKLFVQLNNPDEKQTEACVKRNGIGIKHFSFDGANENHTIESGDRDDCAC